MADSIEACVVVPTRSRGHVLRRCLDALARQETRRWFEIVVVDDGTGAMSIAEASAAANRRLRVVSSHGRGPAAARNLGIRSTSAPVVLFTDDDTLPSRSWLESACAFLERNPQHVGVEGVTVSLPYDYLYEHSVETNVPGRFMTCNIAFRASVLRELGGFDERFRDAYCEDLDLAFRALCVGPIGFEADMQVIHTPRRISLGQLIARGRLASSEARLLRRHPDRWRWPIPVALAPALVCGKHWLGALQHEGWGLLLDPERCGRFAAAASGQLLLMTAWGLASAVGDRTATKQLQQAAQ